MSGIGRGNGRGRSVDSDSVPSSDPDVRSSSGRGAPLGQRISQNTSAPPPQAPITSIGRRKGSDSKGALGSHGRSTAVDRDQSPQELESTTEPRDIRSIAQSIVDEEALGVTSAKGQFIKATDTVTWLNGHRVHFSLLAVLIAAAAVLLPAYIEQASRERASEFQALLQAEAVQFAEEVGPGELSLQIRERRLDEVRRAYRLKQQDILGRIRASGIALSQADLTVRPDFENEGLLLAALLDRGGDEGTVVVWGTTHGKPFGRPLPDPQLTAVLQTHSERIAVIIQTTGMALLAIWIIPPLLRRRSYS